MFSRSPLSLSVFPSTLLYSTLLQYTKLQKKKKKKVGVYGVEKKAGIKGFIKTILSLITPCLARVLLH